MTNNKRMAMPESWEFAAYGFLEYKRAAGVADTSLLTLRRRLRAFAAEICTPPELVSQQQLVCYLASRKAVETKQLVHGVLHMVRSGRVPGGQSRAAAAGRAARHATP